MARKLKTYQISQKFHDLANRVTFSETAASSNLFHPLCEGLGRQQAIGALCLFACAPVVVVGARCRRARVPTTSRWLSSSVPISINRSLRSGSSQFRPWIEYCIAAASSPFAPPNCSKSIFPNRGSGSSTRTVYMSFLTWWYIANSRMSEGCAANHRPGQTFPCLARSVLTVALLHRGKIGSIRIPRLLGSCDNRRLQRGIFADRMN